MQSKSLKIEELFCIFEKISVSDVEFVLSCDILLKPANSLGQRQYY